MGYSTKCLIDGEDCQLGPVFDPVVAVVGIMRGHKSPYWKGTFTYPSRTMSIRLWRDSISGWII
jgi:hypothetical protein